MIDDIKKNIYKPVKKKEYEITNIVKKEENGINIFLNITKGVQ